MFKRDDDLLYAPENLFLWFLLAFQGGALNTGGYLAVHRFVSHVTGFATLAGEAGAEANWGTMVGMLMVPIFFLFGVIISAWNIERQRIKDRLPRYSLVFSIIVLNIFIVAAFGSMGFFGTFGDPLSSYKSYFVLCLLAFTCGLQNAVITSASGAIIRTTHLTGPTTDFGIGLVRVWSTRKNVHHKEVFALWCRAGIYFSFVGGSFISAFAYLHFHYMGFFLPLLISAYSALRLRAIHLRTL